MPDLTGQATTFRGDGYRCKLYLSYLPQTVVLACSVNGTPDYSSGSIQTLTVDTVTSGSVSAALAGYTVEIQSSAGVHKGYTRMAYGGGSGSTLQIAELSIGSIDITDGDLVKVYQSIRITDKLVSATAALNKDSRETYSDQNNNYPPICNSGGPVVGFVSGSSLSANFYGGTSQAIDPDSGGTITHSWSFPGCTPSSSSSANPTGIAIPAGDAFFATHIATDASNSKATTQYIPVWAHDTSSNAPISLSQCTLNYTEDEGWAADFQIADESLASATLLPPGALVVIWAVEHFGTTEASYGSNVTGRSHIKFVGYLSTVDIDLEPVGSAMTLHAISPLGAMARTGALPQLAIRKAAPTKWQHLKGLTVFTTLWYLWKWHNTLFDLFDYIPPTITDNNYSRLAAGDTSNQLAQYRDLASSMALLVSCDRLGRVICEVDLMTLNSSDRSSRTVQYNYTLADLTTFRWQESYWWPTKTVVAEGITAATSTKGHRPVYARAPGTAPAARAINTETLTGLIGTQSQINQRAMMKFMQVNSLYEGRFVPRDVPITLPDPYIFLDPALPEFLTFTIPSTSNGRGTSFSTATRWRARSANLIWNADGIDVNYTIDHETYSSADATSLTEIRPTPSSDPLPPLPSFTIPDLTLPGWELPIIEIDEPINVGTDVMIVLHEDGLSVTSDANTPEGAGGPTYTNTTASALGVTGTISNGFVDPTSPKLLGTGTTVNIWLATDQEIGLISDAGGTPSYTSKKTFTYTATSTNRQSIGLSRVVADLIAVITDYVDTTSHNGVYSIVSDDAGATWGSEYQLSANYDSADIERDPGVYVGRGGIIYTTAYDAATAALPGSNGFGSDDSGASYSILTSPNMDAYGLAGGLHFPWHDNAGETIAYYGSAQDGIGFGTGDIGFTSVPAATSNVGPNDFDQSLTGVIVSPAEVSLTWDVPAKTIFNSFLQMQWSCLWGHNGNTHTQFKVKATPRPDYASLNYSGTCTPADRQPDLYIVVDNNALGSSTTAQLSSSKTVVGDTIEYVFNLGADNYVFGFAMTMRGWGSTGGTCAAFTDIFNIQVYEIDSSSVTGGSNTLYRAEGTTQTDITPQDEDGFHYTARHQRAIHTPDNNRHRVCVCGTHGDGTKQCVFLSSDDGDTWTQVTDVDDTGSLYEGCYVTPSGMVWVWGDHYLGVGEWTALLAGSGFDDRTGDMPNQKIKLIAGA